jgi:choline-sulfatase
MYLPGVGAHPPYGAPEDYFARYTSNEVRAAQPLRALVPGNAKPPHLQPGGITGFRNLTSFHGGAADDELFYELQAVYLGRVAFVDYVLGTLMRGIDASPLANRTALLVHSDHGDYGGDWQAVEKWPGAAEDVLTRVPLIVRIPGGAAGVRVAAPVMSVDLYPTLLELAGIARTNLSSVINGLSLMPWLAGGVPPPQQQQHKFVFSEGGYSNYNEYEPNDPAQHADYADPTGAYFPRGREELDRPLDIDRFIMVRRCRGSKQRAGRSPHLLPLLRRGPSQMRNATAKLVYRPRGVSELYDMVADPRELLNVIDTASFAPLRAEMTAELLRWLVLTSDVTPTDDDPRGLPATPVPPFPWPPRERADAGASASADDSAHRAVGGRLRGATAGA